MLADTAIAVNPDDERYTRLVGEAAILPLVGRRLPIIADHHVDPEFGTGALKITPGPRPERLRDRPQARPRRDQRDRRGRPHDRRGRRAVRGHDRRGGAPRGGRRAARGRPHLGHPALRARRAALAPLGPADRAADLAAVVLRHERLAGPAIEAVRDGTRALPPREAVDRRLPATGSRTSGRGASPASSGGATRSRSGTAGEETLRGGSRRPAGEGWERDPDVLDTWFSLGAVAVRDARLARADRRSCAPSTRPTSSRPRATSSSSGSPGW